MIILLLLIALQGAVDELAHARRIILDAHAIMVVGVDEDKRAVIRVVQAETGAVLAQTRGTSPRWYPAQKYVVLRREGSWYAFHVPSGRLEGPLSQNEVFTRSIRYGNALERFGTLQNVLKDTSTHSSSDIQTAVRDRLSAELDAPLPSGKDELSLRERRTRERELDLLLRFAGVANAPSLAPLIVSADSEAARGALLDLGRSSIPLVLKAWREPPTGVSENYRPRLLETLHHLMKIYPDAVSGEIRQIVRAVLRSPSGVRAALAAIRFADDIDDSEALTVVSQYANDHIFTAARIHSLEDARLVTEVAANVLSRRVTIR